jgi:outer membrane protein assembly factor BamA
MRFHVTGGKSSRATGVAGYSPADRRITGLLEFRSRNLFDTGRRLEVSWFSAEPRAAYYLSYTEPWVLRTGFSLTGSAGHEVTDTSFASTSLGLGVATSTAAGLELKLETGFDRVVAGTPSRVDVVWVGTGLVDDLRDVPGNPSRGVYLDVRTRAGNRTQDSGRVSFVGRVEADGAAAVPVIGRFVWSNTVAARWVYAGVQLTEPELYRCGGAMSVRGYREGEFVSYRVAWLSSEVRYRLGRMSRAYPFIDVGVFQDSHNWYVKPAAGVGLRAATGLGVFGLDYGVALGDDLLRGKMHMRLEAEF